MKRQLFGFVGLLGLALSFGALGCGSSGGGGDSAATMASCNAYCTKYIAAACTNPIYTSVADCQTNDCTVPASAPSGCQAAAKAWYDCQTAEADICADTSCDAQFSAITTSCN